MVSDLVKCEEIIRLVLNKKGKGAGFFSRLRDFVQTDPAAEGRRRDHGGPEGPGEPAAITVR